MKRPFWERYNELLASGMSIGEASDQARLDEICEMHDSMIDELYPSTKSTNDPDVI